ncbi:hypothetical protein ERX27_03565 [Macrococcus brunensis]|uniref:Uncharacterized protein n=1 Tax=Macrococcus brunensis TaxID=198483 RepID=A0A4R6BF99_9STAP|nr:hypothetical protein [Macrococcus brunensis]TDL98527.1 hypothetical protein ERX27_03565 [Macrococcus brunensis]
MGIRRTWYLNSTVDEILHEIKIMNNFSNMSDTLEYLIKNQKENIQQKELVISEIDKNIQMLLEMVAWQCDKTDTIPSISVAKGFSDAYNNSKKIVDENIERSMRLKRQGL